MTITWTKCSERMPPDKPGHPIIAKLKNGSIDKVSSRWFINIMIHRIGKDCLEWTEFTPEKWEFLNR